MNKTNESNDSRIEDKISKPPATKESLISAVAAQLQERIGSTRKIHYLFNSAQSAFFRVNYLRDLDGLVDSYWIEVKAGVVTVNSETNKAFVNSR